MIAEHLSVAANLKDAGAELRELADRYDRIADIERTRSHR